MELVFVVAVHKNGQRLLTAALQFAAAGRQTLQAYLSHCSLRLRLGKAGVVLELECRVAAALLFFFFWFVAASRLVEEKAVRAALHPPYLGKFWSSTRKLESGDGVKEWLAETTLCVTFRCS